MTFDLEEYLTRTTKLVSEFADRVIPPQDGLACDLYAAMRYSFFAGGKRFRPALAYASAEAVSGDGMVSIPFGVAIEMIHTYSLIHDDLPAMDNDDLRRGQPTCHIKFGEAIAILAGDTLLTDAFTMLSSPEMAEKYTPAVLLRCIYEISRASGGKGMAAGQALDIASEGKILSLPALEFLHTHKTGALIRASVMTGAIAAGAGPEQEKALSRYADRVGLAFQIADDILDVVGDTETLGKPAGSDEAHHKATYPALLGLEEARRRLDELTVEAVAATKPFGERGEPLRALARFVAARKS